jgi:predicted permease
VRALQNIFNWFRAIIRRNALESDLRSEVRFHLEHQIEQHISSGMSPAEARRQALRDFGGLEKFSEECRDARRTNWLHEALQDFRYALRVYRSNPSFAVVTVLTLALGIAANSAMFSLANAWLLRPLPLKNPQELVSVWRTRSQAPRQPAFFNFFHDYLIWQSRNTSFSSLAASFEQSYTLTGAANAAQLFGGVATPNFFDTVGAVPELGRLFQSGDAQSGPSCVLSHAVWVSQFDASPDIVGRSIQLNRQPYRVLGVLPEKFSFRVLDRPLETAVWIVIRQNDADYSATSASPVAVIGRLKRGVTAAQAEADLSNLQAALNLQFTDEPEHSGVLVANLQQDNARELRNSLLLLSAAGAILLLIACVNAGSLILGRNAQRTHEFAVRVALGCGTSRLLRQLTAEILTVFAAGALAGLLLAFALLRLFVVWDPFQILPPGGITLDLPVLLSTAIIVSLAALAFGSLPALWALHVREHDALRASTARTTASGSHLRGRAICVAAQIALSVILLLGAGLLISTFRKLASEPLGFATEDVSVSDVALPNASYPTVADQNRFSQTLLQRLRQVPAVRSAGLALSWQFQVNGGVPVETEAQSGRAVDQLPQAAAFDASPGYFAALGIALLRGRTFDDHDLPGSLPVAVVNEELARSFFPHEDALGKKIRFHSDAHTPPDLWLTIVGVVSTTSSLRYNQMQWDRYPAMYTCFFQRREDPARTGFRSQTIQIFLRASAIDRAAVGAVVHSIDPDVPLGSFQTVDHIVGKLRSQPQVRAVFMAAFAVWTVLLAAVGVGGIMAQSVEQRRHEVGVRMALGAQRGDVLRLVLTQGLKLTLAGLAIGVSISLLLARLLSSFSQFLYGIRPTDPLTLLAVCLTLTAVALLAAYLPARRATRLDPLIALRHD